MALSAFPAMVPGTERLAYKRARDQAERERAAIDEPVIHAEAQTELEAAAAADKAEADTDADLEIWPHSGKLMRMRRANPWGVRGAGGDRLRMHVQQLLAWGHATSSGVRFRSRRRPGDGAVLDPGL
jgi:hypothetical protein